LEDSSEESIEKKKISNDPKIKNESLEKGIKSQENLEKQQKSQSVTQSQSPKVTPKTKKKK
jgi:hypothetical protein